MNSKLTLSVEKEVIEQAKKYARKKGQSLSELVENYFKLLTITPISQVDDISAKVNTLRGILKVEEGFDYKKILDEEINQKHGC